MHNLSVRIITTAKKRRGHNNMKEQLQAIIEAIVSNPNEVSIEEKPGEHLIVFEVKVSESDMGKVIGREGRIAKSIRTVMRAIAIKEGKKISIEFVD